jgi:hypothetical protein
LYTQCNRLKQKQQLERERTGQGFEPAPLITNRCSEPWCGYAANSIVQKKAPGERSTGALVSGWLILVSHTCVC